MKPLTECSQDELEAVIAFARFILYVKNNVGEPIDLRLITELAALTDAVLGDK